MISCKECKWYKNNETCTAMSIDIFTSNDFFCAYFESKEQKKTCDECKYLQKINSKYYDIDPFCMNCSRNYPDRFKKKEL